MSDLHEEHEQINEEPCDRLILAPLLAALCITLAWGISMEWQLPSATDLPPGDLLVLWPAGNGSPWAYGAAVGAFFGLLIFSFLLAAVFRKSRSDPKEDPGWIPILVVVLFVGVFLRSLFAGFQAYVVVVVEVGRLISTQVHPFWPPSRLVTEPAATRWVAYDGRRLTFRGHDGSILLRDSYEVSQPDAENIARRLKLPFEVVGR